MSLARAFESASGALAVAVLLALTASTPAAAQTVRPPFPRFEVGAGGGVAGPAGLGDRDATLLSNNTAGSPFRLFATDARLQPSAVVEARLGYRVSSRLTAEGRLTVGRPSLRVSISADAEDAAALDATSTVTEYAIDGGAIWRLTGNARRWIPFASGGAGVARHVHDGRTLSQHSASAYAGGGVLHALGSNRALARTALRFDARLQLLHGGIAEGAGFASRAVVTASVSVAF